MRIEELLAHRFAHYEFEPHVPAHTARALARALHARPHQVAKSVVVEANGTPVMCVVPADRRVDFDQLRSVLGCRDVRLASEAEIQRLCTECEVGAEPPVGELYGVATVMDESLRDEPWVYFSAGKHDVAIAMNEADLERVSKARLAHFTKPAQLDNRESSRGREGTESVNIAVSSCLRKNTRSARHRSGTFRTTLAGCLVAVAAGVFVLVALEVLLGIGTMVLFSMAPVVLWAFAVVGGMMTATFFVK